MIPASMLGETGMEMIQNVYGEILPLSSSLSSHVFQAHQCFTPTIQRQNKINLDTHSHHAKLCFMADGILASISG